MTEATKLFNLICVIFILLLALASSFGGVIGEIIRYLAFLIPTVIGFYYSRDLQIKREEVKGVAEEPDALLGFDGSRAKLLLPIIAPVILVVFLISLLTSLVLSLFGIASAPVEDVGIVLGQAFKKALGDMKGIIRYGTTILPMDESLIMTALDISGRSYLKLDLPVRASKIGDFPVELVEEFFQAFVRHAGITLHVVKVAGTNSHHVVEGAFKSFARSLKSAVAIDKDFANEIPSTKGVL